MVLYLLNAWEIGITYFYFFPSEETEDDAAGVELAYIQARSDILSSRYPTTGRCAYLLAALQLQEELGDFYRSSVTGNNIPIHAENADAEEEVTALSDDAYLPLSFLNKYLHTDHLIGNIEVMEEEKDGVNLTLMLRKKLELGEQLGLEEQGVHWLRVERGGRRMA